MNKPTALRLTQNKYFALQHIRRELNQAEVIRTGLRDHIVIPLDIVEKMMG